MTQGLIYYAHLTRIHVYWIVTYRSYILQATESAGLYLNIVNPQSISSKLSMYIQHLLTMKLVGSTTVVQRKVVLSSIKY